MGEKKTEKIMDNKLMTLNVDDLYTEAYNEQSYHLFKSSSLTGNAWSQVNFTPPVARHGCIIKIDESLYKKIIAAYSTH